MLCLSSVVVFVTEVIGNGLMLNGYSSIDLVTALYVTALYVESGVGDLCLVCDR